MELRCPARVLHGVASDNATGTLEVKCRGSWCGHAKGVVVLHVFNLSTGNIVETKRFSDPTRVFQQANAKKRRVG